MREPVAKRRPMIDLEEFERRLRQPNAANRKEGDPLAELARFADVREDPYKSVFAAQGPGSIKAWEESDGNEPYPRDRSASADFASIEAGLLGVRRRQMAAFDEAEDANAFLDMDDGSEHWGYENEPAPSAPMDDPADEIRSRRPLYLMAAIIVVGVAGIGASFALKGGASGVREVATIRAADGPAKIQPETTATAEIPDQDASILNRTSQSGPIALVNNGEQPVDLSQVQEKAPRVIALGGARPHSDNGSVGGAASVPVPAPEPAQRQSQSQSESLGIAGLIEPKKVKTVSVRPDGTVLPNDKPPQAPPRSAPAPNTVGDAAKASTPKTTARVATTPKPAAAPGADGGQAPQVGSAARPRPVQVAAAPGALPAQTSQAGAGTFAVQLAAPASEPEARDIQLRLMKKFGSELAGFHPSIRKAASGDKTVYRVRVGNLSHDEANALCQKIQGGGGTCFVAKN